MSKVTLGCPFCQSKQAQSSVFEDTFFNNKNFEYLKCKSCQLIYIQPFPDNDDYIVMYPPSYQSEVTNQIENRYTYVFEKLEKHTQAKKILDYGCGSGGFLKEALQRGYDCTGVEFNPALIDLLKTNIPQINFDTIDNFYAQNQEKYDIIYLSNVLEHLTNPKEIMKKLQSYLSPKGVFFLEGPIENNFTFALLVRKFFFGFKKYVLKRKANHAPRHIFQSTAKNQQMFFENLGLKTLLYEVVEQPWPFPTSVASAQGAKQKLMALIAKFSMYLTRFNPRWGNMFYYIGQNK